MIEKKYIGKYVCYNSLDGGACWGRIKDEGFVTKLDGEHAVFILEDRYQRYQRTKDLRNFRTVFPSMMGAGDPGLSYQASMDPEDELYFEVRKVRGDSTLWKELVDLENDIVDLGEVLMEVDKDELFKAILGSQGEVNGKTALEIGVQAILKGGGISNEAIEVLRKKLQ